jgi:two-component system nitrogen regulation sensor histidine kinase NtrY
MQARKHRVEMIKRRRERRATLIAFVVLILSVLTHAFFERKKENHQVIESLTYLSVIYFYIFIGIFLLVLVARNLIKSYLERKSGRLGANLKWKIVVSLVTFSAIPSLVLFVGATALIRSGFDQYFGERVAGALEDSQSIVKTHYDKIHRDLDIMAAQSARILRESSTGNKSSLEAKEVFKALPLSRFEIYRSLHTEPEVFSYFEEKLPPIQPALLERAFKGESFRHTERIESGDLIQRLQPYSTDSGIHVIVLSQSVPLALNTRMEDLKSTLVVYHETRNLKNSLKTQYSVVFLVLFVLVLFIVTWFGIYITREITDPVMELLEATNAFRSGKWDYRIKKVGVVNQNRGMSADLELLKSAFNLMAEEVGSRGKKLEELVQDLEGRERYLETLLSSIRRGVLVLDTEGRVVRVNKEALGLASKNLKLPSEASSKEAQGNLHWSEMFDIQPKERFEDFLKAVKIKRGEHLDQVFEVQKDASNRLPANSLRATGVSLFDTESKDLGTLLIVEDISDATRLERLAAWQGVARRVAHEIKNPLTPIQISADRINRRILKLDPNNPDLPLFKECVAQIQKQVRVIRDLVKEFAQFSKLPEPKFAHVQVSKVFEEFLKDYNFTHPDIEIEINKSTDDRLNADSELLRILFVNLVDNSVHSIQDFRLKESSFKGKLSISIEDSPLNPAYLRIVFEDNGPGIEKEFRDKIFDPYTSSKASGMGLGLAIVKRIAEEHHGSIRIEDAQGARFVIDLPRVGK